MNSSRQELWGIAVVGAALVCVAVLKLRSALQRRDEPNISYVITPWVIAFVAGGLMVLSAVAMFWFHYYSRTRPL